MNRVAIGGVRLEVAHVPAHHAPSAAQAAPAPLVFLHEGLGSVGLWRDWPAALCRQAGREGWLYSRRGYGRSDPVPDPRGEPAVTADGLRTGRLPPEHLQQEAWEVLPELLQRLEVTRPPVLVGHSDGASIALLYASRFPVAACVALAPHIFVEQISVDAIAQARVAYEGGDLRRRLARHHDHVDCAFWLWNDAWLSEAFRGFDIRAECRRIAAPVLAIQGRDDPYGTLAQIQDIDLPPAQIRRVALEHCGHGPHRDHPEECLGLVAEFLAGVG